MDNPYKSTETDLEQESSGVTPFGQSEPSGVELHFESKESLVSCKGCVRFISVVLGILMLTITSNIVVQSSQGEFPFSISMLFFIGLSVLVLMLAIRLSKYASAIKRFSLSQKSADFDVLMHTQLKFWILFAITILVFGAFLLFVIARLCV